MDGTICNFVITPLLYSKKIVKIDHKNYKYNLNPFRVIKENFIN